MIATFPSFTTENCRFKFRQIGLIKGETPTVGIHVGTKTRPRRHENDGKTGIPPWEATSVFDQIFGLVDIERLFSYNKRQNTSFFWVKSSFFGSKPKKHIMCLDIHNAGNSETEAIQPARPKQRLDSAPKLVGRIWDEISQIQ